MADQKISQLSVLTAIADDDVFPIVDTSETETKKTTWLSVKSVLASSFASLSGAVFTGTISSPDINISGTLSSPLSAPVSGSVTVNYDSEFNVPSFGNTWEYRVYTYKLINGTQVFSSTYLTISVVDDVIGDYSSGVLSLSLSWTAVAGADGYRIVDQTQIGDFDYSEVGYYQDVETNSATDNVYSPWIFSETNDPQVPTNVYINTNTINGVTTFNGSVVLPILTQDLTARTFISSVATGTAPISVTSTTVCPNLNASYLGGLSSGNFVKYSGNNQNLTLVNGSTYYQFSAGRSTFYSTSGTSTTDFVITTAGAGSDTGISIYSKNVNAGANGGLGSAAEVNLGRAGVRNWNFGTDYGTSFKFSAVGTGYCGNMLTFQGLTASDPRTNILFKTRIGDTATATDMLEVKGDLSIHGGTYPIGNSFYLNGTTSGSASRIRFYNEYLTNLVIEYCGEGKLYTGQQNLSGSGFSTKTLTYSLIPLNDNTTHWSIFELGGLGSMLTSRTNALSFGVARVVKMTLNSTGLGIGNTAATYPLDVYAAATLTPTYGRIESPGGSGQPSGLLLKANASTSTIAFDFYGDSFGGSAWGMNYISGRDGFSNHWFRRDDNSIQLSIIEAGSVGIGTATPNIGAYSGKGLTIYDSNPGFFELIRNSTSADSSIGIFRAGNTSNSTLAGIEFRSGTANNKGVIRLQTSSGSSVLTGLTIDENQNTTILNNLVLTSGFYSAGGDGTNPGAIQLKPANPAYNWYSLVNKETGSGEGFAIQRGAYPSIVETTFACSTAGDITTPRGFHSPGGVAYTAFHPMSSSGTMAASTSYYFGGRFNNIMTTGGGFNRIYIFKSGTIKRCQIQISSSTTASSGENITISLRLNNTTDTALVTAVPLAANTYYTQGFNSLSIAVTAGDYVEFKLDTPAWTVLPNWPSINATFYVE